MKFIVYQFDSDKLKRLQQHLSLSAVIYRIKVIWIISKLHNVAQLCKKGMKVICLQ